MLMSYVADGGTAGGHDLASLSEKWLGQQPIPFKDLVGSGKKLVSFDFVEIDRATAYATEGADLTLRLWQVLKPRLRPKTSSRVYERLERPLVPVLARMEERGITVDRQMLSRLSGEFAQRAAALEDDDLRGGRRALQHRLAEAARRHPVRQDGPARRLEDQDRPVVDHGAGARGTGGRRPRAAAPDRRLAAADQAEIDLYRRAAGLHQPRDEARAHLLRAGLDADRPPLLVRSEPAEHPDPHGRRPARSARPSSRTRATSWSRPTTARSSCACSPISPTSRS